MLHVTLDTGILRKDPQRKSAAMRRFIELIDEGHIALHVPDVVKREFVSGMAAEYRKHLNAAIGELQQVRRDLVDAVKRNLVRSLQELRKVTEDRCERDLVTWLQQVKAHVHAIPEGAAARVIDRYFAGALPFRAVKNRDDFPDAIIWDSLQSILKEVKSLHVVVEDGSLAKASAQLLGVLVHPSLDEFLVSTLDDLASQTDGRLLEILSTDTSRLGQYVRQFLPDALQGREVRSRNIPEDNNEARIAGAYEPHEVTFDVSKIDHLGGGYFSVPFNASSEVSLDYAIYIADWAVLDDARALSMSVSELNDHYYEVEEYADISVAGWLDVHVEYRKVDDQYITNAELRQAMTDATLDLNEVEITSVRIPRGDSAG